MEKLWTEIRKSENGNLKIENETAKHSTKWNELVWKLLPGNRQWKTEIENCFIEIEKGNRK